MICYLKDMTNLELEAVNDYWKLSKESQTGFLYTLNQIDKYYRDKGVRRILTLAKNTVFALNDSSFICQDCEKKVLIKNRTDYTKKTKSQNVVICSECAELRWQRISDDAHETLNSYKFQKFQAAFYLDKLTVEESLALLSISANLSADNYFLESSPEDIVITGVQLADQSLIFSLLEKGALVYLNELPEDVERAISIIYGGFDRVTYDNRYRKQMRYRHPESLIIGVYFIPPDLGELSDFNSELYQKLSLSELSIDDVKSFHQLIKEIQLGKLYQLVMEISREYQIPIDNSNPLRALLNHLAENYAPQNIFFTFQVKARETIVHLHKEKAPAYIAKHYFTKFVGSYVQFVEHSGYELNKIWTLPPQIQTSPFEALFSQIYLNGHFDWNTLSAKEIVALWLKKVRLSEGAQKLLSEDNSILK